MKKVVILQRITGNYRISFFERLSDILENNNISLKILYGQPEPGENSIGSFKSKSIILIKNYYIKLKSKYLVFQFPFKTVLNSNLIILQQGNRIITNYLLLIFLPIVGKKVAIWGNCKQELTSYKNGTFKPGKWWKLSKKVDHWFAYNELTKRIVEFTGFASEKITSVNNSIDTYSEIEIYNTITYIEILHLKTHFDIKENDIVGLFCSRLYPDKRIDFLLKILAKVKENFPNFKFIVVGDGMEASKINEFAKENATWFFPVGSKYGRDKISYFRISDCQLMPGAMGLHIVDSFAMETPIITTESTSHGVEIEYLLNFKNGIITENDLNSYTNAIIRFCRDESLRKQLKKGCREAANLYTVENMAERFAQGIIKTLNCE